MKKPGYPGLFPLVIAVVAIVAWASPIIAIAIVRITRWPIVTRAVPISIPWAVGTIGAGGQSARCDTKADRGAAVASSTTRFGRG
jgi:hypothetical protein